MVLNQVLDWVVDLILDLVPLLDQRLSGWQEGLIPGMSFWGHGWSMASVIPGVGFWGAGRRGPEVAGFPVLFESEPIRSHTDPFSKKILSDLSKNIWPLVLDPRSWTRSWIGSLT